MSTSKQPLPDRFFQALLRLLPFDFRSEFGADMEETFRAQRSNVERERGLAALLKMWWATIADIVRMAPREHASVLAQDTRYALRMMRKNIGYTVSAIVILGLGIGVNTSIFSVVNSVLLKPLPYAQGDRLVSLRQPEPKLGIDDIGFSPMELGDYRAQNHSLSGIVEYHNMTFTLIGGAEAYRVRTGVVSYNYFDLFGVKPVLGRTFVADEERPGAPAVLMLSYEFWKQAEHGDPNIIGKVYQMNDRPHTVIGVLPPIPQYPNENDVYMTSTSCPFRSSLGSLTRRRGFAMNLFGRLKPGATPDMCRADLRAISARLMKDYPAFYRPGSGYFADASVLRDDLTHGARPMLLALLGAAAFVLLIACANVANLILARMARREQELVIRTAVGAGAGRLLRQLLTESLILALLAAMVGIAFASGSLKLLIQFAGQLTPRAREIAIDGWVLGFATLCATGTTVLFGSMAALCSRRDVGSGLKDGARAGVDRGRQVVRSVLIATQVAFSFILLVGAGLMIRSFLEMQRVNPGFVSQRVLAVGINLNFTRFHDRSMRASVANRILEKISPQPGVLSAAVSSSFPMDPDDAGLAGARTTFQIEGRSQEETERTRPVASFRTATPDYFKTLGIPLLSGRTFTEFDRFNDFDKPDTELVAVISGSLAQTRFRGQDPIGKRVSFDRGDSWARIIGIVGDVKEFGPNRDAPETFYLAQGQNPLLGSLLLRTAGDPKSLLTQVRQAVREIDPQIAITESETLEQARADAVASPRTITRLFGVYAGLALVIAVIGIGSMLALWVRQRTREIGIRMALGASPGAILGGVIRQGMLLVVFGLAAGAAGAVAVTRLIKTLLFQVEPTDTYTFALVPALLLAAALLACYVPAKRAARIDPQAALRAE
ncbi:MAG TPA: ABC transporter permease [Bryobacteraceae bacterium]|nr:ABC transporter permease [Bryobacteraceae bacterium]